MIQSTIPIIISWYGRCCFLVEYERQKILFDPYDTYCGVDIGRIDAEILVSSSTWHDHGHIGASPKAHIYSYPGTYTQDEIKIVGIEALEDRGTPTVIFNVQVGPFSITNFADFGPKQQQIFEESVTASERKILAETNVAFIRPSIVRESVAENSVHNEIVLEYCQPNIIFPEHYFPRSFTERHSPKHQQPNLLRPLVIVDEMVARFGYPIREISCHTIQLTPVDLHDTEIYRFSDLHPQVKYQN